MVAGEEGGKRVENLLLELLWLGNCGSKCSSGSNIGVGTGVGA